MCIRDSSFEVSTRLGWGSQIVIFAQFTKPVIWHLLAYEAKSTFKSSWNWSNQLFHQKLAQKQHLELFENFSIFRPFCDHLVTGRAAENWPKQVILGRVENLNSKNYFLFESVNGVSRLKQREKSCFNIKIRQKWIWKAILAKFLKCPVLKVRTHKARFWPFERCWIRPAQMLCDCTKSPPRQTQHAKHARTIKTHFRGQHKAGLRVTNRHFCPIRKISHFTASGIWG